MQCHLVGVWLRGWAKCFRLDARQYYHQIFARFRSSPFFQFSKSSDTTYHTVDLSHFSRDSCNLIEVMTLHSANPVATGWMSSKSLWSFCLWRGLLEPRVHFVTPLLFQVLRCSKFWSSPGPLGPAVALPCLLRMRHHKVAQPSVLEILFLWWDDLSDIFWPIHLLG